ncbi:hypothetical protein [Pseudorhodoferax sp.]|uniref:hypothetical protein n=1 Tax=Pseudorhodoferax sp. TaxID=1993553 RepID=UPI002DD64584|nr:hypothetical protein [Pseudorhodoferax sp.]
MSTTTVRVLHIDTPATPRIATLVGTLYGVIARWLEPRPSPTAAARAANRVRELANRVQASDPGFAADLRCAADRHEADQAGK